MKKILGLIIFLIFLFSVSAQAQQNLDPEAQSEESLKNSKSDQTASNRVRPGSYISNSLNYAQFRTYLDETEDYSALSIGPLHGFASIFRTGDAIFDFFAIGFQVQFLNRQTKTEQISAFALLLDATFYPYKGLGIRPSVGVGFGFAQGEKKWEFGFGGPGAFAFALLYEFRIFKRLSLAPIISTTWLVSEGYHGLFSMAGIEMTIWFRE